jgi:hypothetical protein
MSDLDQNGWITLDVWLERYGEDSNAVQKRINTGIWSRGEHYATPDGGQAYVHEERGRKWLEARGKLVL